MQALEAGLFKTLRLRPGRYSPQAIDRQYRRIRQDILRTGQGDCQERLDQAKIARALLRLPNHQAAILRQERAAQAGSTDVAAKPSFRAIAYPPDSLRTPTRLGTLQGQRAVGPIASAPVEASAHDDFARMVLDHLESGLLRYTARRRLLLLAKGMGIGQFKANLIIAEVLHHAEPLVIVAACQDGLRMEKRRSQHSRRPVILAATLAILLDTILYLWLFT